MWRAVSLSKGLGKLLIGMKINVWISDVCIINHHVIIRVKIGREFEDGTVNCMTWDPM